MQWNKLAIHQSLACVMHYCITTFLLIYS